MNPAEIVFFLIIAIWSFFWKGVALWRAANQKQRNWFIVLLLPVNTVGILELLFLFRFSKKKLTLEEIKSWFSKN